MVLWNWSLFKIQPAGELAALFIKGLRFDASAIALSVAPIVLFLILYSFLPVKWQLKKPMIAFFAVILVLHSLLIYFNFMDTELVNFTGRRTTLGTVFMFREAKGKFWGFVFSYWFIALSTLLALLAYLGTFYKISKKYFFDFQKAKFDFKFFGRLVFLLVIFVVAARGGLQKKPMNFVDARLFTSPQLNQAVTNTTFTILKSESKQAVTRYKFFDSRKKAFESLNRDNTIHALKSTDGSIEKPNIVILILESFSLEYMGLDGRKSYTPFLDSLARSPQSLFFKNSYADGRRSIEGVAAILAGIPAWMEEPFISSEYATNEFLGLGHFLTQQKYETSFFHGGQNGTMYFDSFSKSAGFNKYFGFSEYPNKNDFDGTWGAFDEPYLQYFNQSLSSFKQPFASAIFTLSSHQPYKIPDHYAGQFVSGAIEILPVIQYSDLALKKFFEAAEKQPWFENTIFILMADHTGRTYTEEFNNEIGYYKIPTIVYSPKIKLPAADTNQMVSQIDILPSIQDLLGEDHTLHFGHSIFANHEEPVILYVGTRYLVVSQEGALVWSEQTPAELWSLEGSHMTKPLDNTELKTRLESYLKAQLQLFSSGLYDNKLYYPNR